MQNSFHFGFVVQYISLHVDVFPCFLFLDLVGTNCSRNVRHCTHHAGFVDNSWILVMMNEVRMLFAEVFRHVWSK